MYSLVDTHCHLDFEQFDQDRSALIANLATKSVTDVIVPAVYKKNWQEVLDLATPIERAFQPFVQMTEKRYQEKLKEKEKYERQMEKIRADQDSFFKDMPIVDPNKLDESIRDFATQDLMQNQAEYRWTVENTQGYDRIKGTGDIKNNINFWNEINTKLATHQQDYIDRRNTDQPGGDRTSKVNDAVTVEMDRRKANKEFDAVYRNKEGQLVALFNPRDDSAIEQPIEVPFDQWDKAFVPKERQTKKYVEAIASFDKMINVAKSELRWEDDPTNKSEIESTLESLTFSKDEALSIAVDQLGLEPEEYAGTISADLDDDGIPGTIDDINYFIKENLRQGALTQLSDLRGAYEKRLKETQPTEKPTVSERKEEQRIENYNYVGDKLNQEYNRILEQASGGDPSNLLSGQVNWLGTETQNFKDLVSGMGFSGFVNITDDKDNRIAVEVTNEVTNNKAYIPVGSNPEEIIKRLMIAAGATPREADIYYLQKYQALPGLE